MYFLRSFKFERLFLLLIYTNMHIYTRTNVHIIYCKQYERGDDCNGKRNSPSSRTLMEIHTVLNMFSPDAIT